MSLEPTLFRIYTSEYKSIQVLVTVIEDKNCCLGFRLRNVWSERERTVNAVDTEGQKPGRIFL